MIVLLTDFGLSEYVGVMKGVILSVDARATIVDLCHTITPQSLIEAAWVLRNNYTYFPKGSVFCCVVDPGVGSARRAVVIKTDDNMFIAPDNGLLWETLHNQNIVGIRELAVPPDASSTFHGRDVFAKAAARASLGHFDDLSREIDDIVQLSLHRAGREGIVARIDRFGNVVTNLPPLEKTDYVVTINDHEQSMRHHATYDEASDNELFLITSSCATLEISLRNGNANQQLALAPGQRIAIV